jgi:hypothetical protein
MGEKASAAAARTTPMKKFRTMNLFAWVFRRASHLDLIGA